MKSDSIPYFVCLHVISVNCMAKGLICVFVLAVCLSQFFLTCSVCVSEPSVNAALVQDRLNHEAEELERRLSLLSHRTGNCVSCFAPLCLTWDPQTHIQNVILVNLNLEDLCKASVICRSYHVFV